MVDIKLSVKFSTWYKIRVKFFMLTGLFMPMPKIKITDKTSMKVV